MTDQSRPTVAVLGASANRRKYGNKSVRAHLQQGYEVFPVHPAAGEIEGLKAYPNLASVPVETLDRITVYLPPPACVRSSNCSTSAPYFAISKSLIRP